jgi:hypothetical protein
MLLASLVIRDPQLKSGFANFELGASQSEVVDILGEPHAIVRCGQFGGVRRPLASRSSHTFRLLPS